MTGIAKNMSKNMITALWTDSLLTAYKRMVGAGIRHLPVLDSSEKLVGIISDRDFQRAMCAKVKIYDTLTMVETQFDPAHMVRDFMSFPVKTVHVDTEIKAVTERMIEEKVSAFLVTREDEIVGIVTHEDLLKVLAQILAKEGPSITQRVEGFAYNSTIGSVADFIGRAGI